jgi:hypothetical protein
MYLTSSIIKDKRYPSWIVSHPIFKEVNRIHKIFPAIGLPNSSSTFDRSLAHESADNLLGMTYSYLGRAYFIENNDFTEAIKKIKEKNYFIRNENGKISFSIPQDILSKDNKIILKEKSSIFTFLRKLNNYPGLQHAYEDISSSDQFKDFSQVNFDYKNSKLIFSSDPWDIATMSMRGITTCQSWDGQYSQALIGSMIDPFVGMLYIANTKRTTPRGWPMLYRSIVRYAMETLPNGNKNPILVLDTLYRQYNKEVVDYFKNFLEAKTGIRCIYLPLIPTTEMPRMYLPRSILTDKFPHYSCREKIASPNRIDIQYSIEPYQNNIIRRASKNDTYSITQSCQARQKAAGQITMAIDLYADPSELNPHLYDPNKAPGILLLRNRYLRHYTLLKTAALSLKNKIEEDLNNRNIDSFFYKKNFYFKFINNKAEYLKNMSGIVKEWNSLLFLKHSAALSKQDFVQIMKQYLKPADNHLKAELKALFLTDAS